MSAQRKLIDPPRWTTAELEAERLRAIENFREQRMKEPLDDYIEMFENRHAVFHDLLEGTLDLTKLSDMAISILTDAKLRREEDVVEVLEPARYLAGPPISLDDLMVLAEVESLSPKRLRADPSLAQRLIDTVLLGLDRARFPWIHDQREPTEEERRAAVLASAAMLASARMATKRRNEDKTEQENRVDDFLLTNGYTKVPTRKVDTMADGPRAGELCRESTLVGSKADLLVGLWDTRMMPIECKVSNSETNSIKRLVHEAAGKAVHWLKQLGPANVVPAAVLSGVYNIKNLEDAQTRGLTLFWAHDLKRLSDWIALTKTK